MWGCMMENNNKYKSYLVGCALLLMFFPLVLRLINKNYSVPLKWSGYFLSQYNLSSVVVFGISILLSLLSLIFIYFTLKNLKINSQEIFFTIILLIISPAFIYIYIIPSNYTLVFFLISLGFYLLTLDNEYLSYIGVVPLLFIIFLGELVIVPLIFILFYLLWIRKKIIVSLILIVMFTFFYLSSPKINLFSTNNYFVTLISDFGGFTGIILSVLILALIGLFMTKKIKLVSLPVGVIIFFVFISNYNWHYLVYIIPLICLSASKTIHSFISNRWEIGIIKKATLLIILCTLLFSSVSYSERIAYSDPSLSMINSLDFINGLGDGNVLSYPDNQFLIEYYGKKEGVLKYGDENYEIFSNKNLRKFNEYLNSNSIKYIWITPEMKKELWNNDVGGMSYLLNEYEQFEKIYDYGGYEVWKVESVKKQ